MLSIDGSLGEGGGQILRSSLALAAVTQQPIRIIRIRSKRPKPGLQRQHLAAVLAAGEVAQAELSGATLHSKRLTFAPNAITPGDYTFDIGTAGSSSLVLQTVLPMLMQAEAPSHLTLQGGTHNEHAPPFDFLAQAFLPLLRLLGPQVSAELVRPGFYPAGGGEIQVSIQPGRGDSPLQLHSRGSPLEFAAVAYVSRLPRHIGERELRVFEKRLGFSSDQLQVIEVEEPRGPGNAIVVSLHFEHVSEVVVGFGRKGLPAEQLAGDVADEVETYLAADYPVGEHLADQLLLPLALTQGGSYRTAAPSLHTTTNIETLQTFLGIEIQVEQLGQSLWQIDVPAWQAESAA